MKLIKFQLGGNIKNLPLTDVQKFQLNQVNPLTGKKPEIRGWEINNGELDVVTAESGTKLESKEATPFMNFFKFLIPGFKQAYDQKLAQENYDAKMKAQYRVRVPLQEPPESIYKSKVQLAKKPQTTVAQNKPALKKRDGLVKKHQLGTYKGGIQPVDNTRVASGRPQVIQNRIPYGAGKGPAGESPLTLLDQNITSNSNIQTGAPTFLPGRWFSPKVVRQFRRYNTGLTHNPNIVQDAFQNTMVRTGGNINKANEVSSSVAMHEQQAQLLRDRFTNNQEWLYRTALGGALAGSSYMGAKKGAK